jgi:hypothetical protein
MDAEFADCQDSDSVSDQRQGEYCDAEENPFPWRSEEKLARENAGYEKNPG